MRLARPMPNSPAAVLRKLGLMSLLTAVPIAGMATGRPALLCFQHSRAGVCCLGVPVKGLCCGACLALGSAFTFNARASASLTAKWRCSAAGAAWSASRTVVRCHNC